MAFAKRKMPQVGRRRGFGRDRGGGRGRDPLQGRRSGRRCTAPRPAAIARPAAKGRDNLCENVAGIMGFHIDGFARELHQPARAARHPGAEGRVLRAGGLRADRLRHRAAHAVRQRQARTRRIDPRPCGRLRHRHRRDQDGEGDRLHRLHDGRRRREGREGEGARRRLRHQLPHRALRGRGPPAHQAQGRRRGVRACRRRDLERLAALPQARRPPRHLRLDARASPRP